MNNNEPRLAGAFRMCISCGERPCETTAHDCCNQCAAITKTRAYVKQGREWQEYKCDHYRSLLEEVLDMLHGGVGNQALSDYLISAVNYLQLELVRMEDLYK